MSGGMATDTAVEPVATLAEVEAALPVLSAVSSEAASVTASVRLMFDGSPSRVSVAAGQSFAEAAQAWCSTSDLQGADRDETVALLIEALRTEHERLLAAAAQAAVPQIIAQIDVLLDGKQVILEQGVGQSPEEAARAFLFNHKLETHLEADTFMRTFVHRLRAAAGEEDGLPRLQHEHGLTASIPVNIAVDEATGGDAAARGEEKTVRYMLRMVGGESIDEAVNGFVSRLGLTPSRSMLDVLHSGLKDLVASPGGGNEGGNQPFREDLSPALNPSGVSPTPTDGAGPGGRHRSNDDDGATAGGLGGGAEAPLRGSSGGGGGDGPATGGDGGGGGSSGGEAASAPGDGGAAGGGPGDQVGGQYLRIPIFMDGVAFEMALPLGPPVPDPVDAAAEFLTAVSSSSRLPRAALVEGEEATPDAERPSILDVLDAGSRTQLLVQMAGEVKKHMRDAGIAVPVLELGGDEVEDAEAVVATVTEAANGAEAAAAAAVVEEADAPAPAVAAAVEEVVTALEVEAAAVVEEVVVQEEVYTPPSTTTSEGESGGNTTGAVPVPPPSLLANLKQVFARFFSL